MNEQGGRSVNTDPMSMQRIWRLIKQSVSAWSEDYAPSMGAAIAYYTLFSIAPLLVIVIAIAGLVFGTAAAQNAIVVQLEGLIGYEGAVAIQGLLRSASDPARGAISSVVGVITLAVGATTVFAELQSALDPEFTWVYAHASGSRANASHERSGKRSPAPAEGMGASQIHRPK